MDLREPCFHLRHHRRMFLPDDRYFTAVAFIEGFDTARDGVTLKGFQEWVSERIHGGHSPLHWSYILASAKHPRISEENLSINEVPLDLQISLVDDLLDLLEEFLEGSRGSERS